MKIFISYSHANQIKVKELQSILENEGHNAWFDREISGGENWWKRIIESIKSCDIFIFALSPQSTNSKACQTEFHYALALNKPIIPVMLQTAELPVGKLQETQYVDARNLKKSDVIVALNKAINRITESINTGHFTIPNPLPDEPQFPFPPDPFSEIRDQFKVLKTLSEADLVSLVYHIQSVALSSKKATQEARDLLREIIVNNPSLPHGVVELAKITLNSLPKANNRRTGLLAISAILVVILLGLIVLLPNILSPQPNPTTDQSSLVVSQSIPTEVQTTTIANQPTVIVNQFTPTVSQPTFTINPPTHTVSQFAPTLRQPISFPAVITNFDWEEHKNNTYIWDGENFNKVLNGKGNDVAISPDYSKLAYDNQYTNEIWVVHIDGSNDIQLTNDAANDLFPSWHPDGSQIIYSKKPSKQNYAIYMMNADGTNQHILLETSANDIFPSFSPNGLNIAFVRVTGDTGDIPETSDSSLWFGQLYIINTNGTNLHQIPNASRVSYPTWSPDGKRVAFHSDQDGKRAVYVINVDGSGLRRLSNGVRPTWSRDGDTIFFGQNIGPQEEKIFRLDLSNSESLPTLVEFPDKKLNWLFNFSMLPH